MRRNVSQFISTALLIILFLGPFTIAKDGSINPSSRPEIIVSKKRITENLVGITFVDKTKSFNTYLKKNKHNLTGAIVIRTVHPGSPADTAGLNPGDFISAVDGKPLDFNGAAADFEQRIAPLSIGTMIDLMVTRVNYRVTLNNAIVGNQNRYLLIHEMIDKESVWASADLAKRIERTEIKTSIELGRYKNRYVDSLQREHPPIDFSSIEESFEFTSTLDPKGDLGVQQKTASVAKIISNEGTLRLPGTCQLELFIHQHPKDIRRITNTITDELSTSNDLQAIKTAARYLDSIELADEPIPDLPTNEVECLAQLDDAMARFATTNEIVSGGHKPRNPQKISEFFERMRRHYLNDRSEIVNLGPDVFEFDDVHDLEPGFNLASYCVKFFSEERLARFQEFLRSPQSRILELKHGTLIVGSNQDDRHAQAADLIVDFGGNDTYLSLTDDRRKSVIIDYSGDDTYTSRVPYEIGSGFMSVSYLLDAAGNDNYIADTCSIASGFGGVGLLRDLGGNDRYYSVTNSIAVGLFGAGLLFDHAGDDVYISGFTSQGVGLVGGLGMIVDRSGDDRYVATGFKESSYSDKRLYSTFSQGVGYGLRRIARGGVGLLVDGNGNDNYQSGNFAQGVGYYFGTGVLIDRFGDDTYRCSRYGLGAAAHDASAIFVDRHGNDEYTVDEHAICGAAWDRSVAYFLDENGNDRYSSRNPFSFGAADQNGLAFHLDLDGNDVYSSNFYTAQSNFYQGGSSFGLFVNQNGSDRYPEPYEENQSITNNEFLFIDK